MTATQAQAANPAAAEHQDVTSADATDAEPASSSPVAEAQRHADQTSIVQDQPNAALLQSGPDSALRGEQAADVVQGVQSGDDDHDGLADTQILMIEDAAELTCDRAALILRQLSCECEAAESCARKCEATGTTSVAEQEQQALDASKQVEANHQSAACIPDAEVAGTAVQTGMILSPAMAHTRLDEAEAVAEGPDGKGSGVQGQPSTAGNAAGVQRGSDGALPSPQGRSPTSILNAASLQATPVRDALRDAACTGMEQRVGHPPASTTQAPLQQGVPSFLQRLQMSKHAGISGPDVTPHHFEDRRQSKQP